MKKNIPIIVSVTGWSGSGKTTFCEELIRELSSRGLRVSAVKNSHQNLNVDKAGSDSDRFFNSGADAVILNANNSMTLFRHQRVSTAEELKMIFNDSEFIIAEGFKAEDAIKIEVTGTIENIDEIKNPAIEAAIIIYGNEKLIDNIIHEYGTQAARIKFIERNNIEEAANLITGH